MSTTTYAVRFSSRVIEEMQAVLESEIDPTEEPALHALQLAMDDARIVIRRKNWTHTYEVVLPSLDVVEAFAREVAWYKFHNEEIRDENRGWGEGDSSITPTINACKNALANANKILESAGRKTIYSYFQ